MTMHATIERRNHTHHILGDQFKQVFVGHQRLHNFLGEGLSEGDAVEVEFDNAVSSDDQLCLYSADDHPHGRCAGCGAEHWIVHLGPCPRCGLEDGGLHTGELEQEAKENGAVVCSPELSRLQPLLAAGVVEPIGRDEFEYVER